MSVAEEELINEYSKKSLNRYTVATLIHTVFLIVLFTVSFVTGYCIANRKTDRYVRETERLFDERKRELNAELDRARASLADAERELGELKRDNDLLIQHNLEATGIARRMGETIRGNASTVQDIRGLLGKLKEEIAELQAVYGWE